MILIAYEILRMFRVPRSAFRVKEFKSLKCSVFRVRRQLFRVTYSVFHIQTIYLINKIQAVSYIYQQTKSKYSALNIPFRGLGRDTYQPIYLINRLTNQPINQLANQLIN